jgi:DNA modification methylase
VAGQIGLEQTPDEYVAEMVAVFREVRRVLRDDGTLWLNLGDSYASYRDGKATPDTTRGNSTGTLVPKGEAKNRMASTFKGSAIKHKDLIGIPWRVAFALQADGWYLRQDIIWSKPNPMPESVKDRCTKAHEYIFLLSKSARYYYDNKAIMEPAVYGEEHANKATSWGTNRKHPNKANVADYAFIGDNHTTSKMADGSYGRNKRSVWTVNTQPYKGAHFATFPPDLIKPCILAGCPAGGTVLDPFGGSGTTGAVASANGRSAILIELNSKYAELVNDRCGLFLSKD